MSDKKPNIIVMIVDNMPADALGCYGNTDAHTPNLDRLAAQGIRFNNGYCVNGVCSPARAAVILISTPFMDADCLTRGFREPLRMTSLTVIR